MDRSSFGRKDRLIKEKRHDAYLKRLKLSEPTICSQCGAVFSNGRWTWKEEPQNAHKIICPACQRHADHYPAGIIEISGQFYKDNKTEILNLIQNTEKLEKGERPLERLISIKDSAGVTVIKTTGIHLARRIGEALSRAYKGDYSFNYADGEDYIQVFWRR